MLWITVNHSTNISFYNHCFSECIAPIFQPRIIPQFLCISRFCLKNSIFLFHPWSVRLLFQRGEEQRGKNAPLGGASAVEMLRQCFPASPAVSYWLGSCKSTEMWGATQVRWESLSFRTSGLNAELKYTNGIHAYVPGESRCWRSSVFHCIIHQPVCPVGKLQGVQQGVLWCPSGGSASVSKDLTTTDIRATDL